MATKESLQHKLDRVRPPRVQITYDVEVGGAIELKELPFVLGIMGDFSGKPDEALPVIKNRKFVEIDPDNFNKVLSGMKPRIAYNVENKMQNDGSKVGVDLRFNNIEDFEPDNVVQQVEPLRKLVEARKKLSDLRSKMDGNEKLENLLNDVIGNMDKQKQLSDQLGLGNATGDGGETKNASDDGGETKNASDDGGETKNASDDGGETKEE